MTMQAARIWYAPGSRTVSLDFLYKRLTGLLGCTVAHTEWVLGETRIPQLHVTAPVSMLIQIANHDDVAAEAVEFASFIEKNSGPSSASAKMRTCTRRLEIGAPDDAGTSSKDGTVVIGPTALDPADPATHRILVGLTSGLDGVFEDNVNGRLIVTPRKPKGLLARLLRR